MKVKLMATTKIERVPCYMAPDPCPEDDYRITGEDVDGQPFSDLVHHRGQRCWMMDRGNLREEWLRFESLQECIDYLEDLLGWSANS